MKKAVYIFKHAAEDSLGLLPDALKNLNIDYVECDISAIDQPLPDALSIDWAIFLGSPEAAYDDSLPWIAREIAYIQALHQRDIPILGICFGSQILARSVGGSVALNTEFEYAWVELNETAKQMGFPQGPFFSFHFDAFTPPPQATLLSQTDLANQAYVCGSAMGCQFHPEINSAMFDLWLDHWSQNAQGQAFIAQYQDDIAHIKQLLEQNQSDNLVRLEQLLAGFLENCVNRICQTSL